MTQESPKACQIVSLKIENVKRVEAVEIHPDGNLVVIGGNNGQGKTTTLDCIAYGIGGKRGICEEPVRRGADAGKITMDLGRFIVERTFDKSGTTKLVVKSSEGAKFGSPQELLDGLRGQIGFDPLAFSRMEKGEQATMLRELLGIDTTALDGERARVFDQRTAINRDGHALKARFEAMPHHADAPEEPVDTADLARQLEESTASEQVGLDRSNEVQACADQIEAHRSEIDDLDRRIKNLCDEKKATASALNGWAGKVDNLNTALREARAAVIEKDPIMKQIEKAGEVNNQISENKQRAQCETELDEKRQAAQVITDRLDEIDCKKTALIAAIKFPVEELGFSDQGVTYKDVPFAQASSAEQLQVSVAIGIAMNPDLRVMLLRDGSLLDDQSMSMISRMAEEKKIQIWLERVGKGDEVSVIIENGMVAG